MTKIEELYNAIQKLKESGLNLKVKIFKPLNE